MYDNVLALIRRFFYGINISISSLGYLFFGIEHICRKLEHSDSYMTIKLLQKFGVHLGDGTNFKGSLIIDNASKDKNSTNDFSHLSIGNRCYIGKKVFFDLPDTITLHDEVVVSAGVTFLSHADCGNRLMGEYYPRKIGPIVVGKGSWIGANATILCNVSLGEMCVVAAGSVVTRSFGDNEIIGGIPATKIGTLREK